MGVLTKPLLRATQRLDLEDWDVLLSSIQTDFKFLTKEFLSSSNYILKGFTVTGLGLNTATVAMANATLIMGANTANYSFFTAETGASNLTISSSSLTANTRNYVELKLVEDQNTPATKVFWDKTANSGAGAEFQQTVDTITDIAVETVVNTSGFTGSADRIPLCILDLDASGLIKIILDRRPLFFRLGTVASPDADYSWVSQVEPPYTVTLSSVSGTFTAGEVVTFSSGPTATVVSGGTTSITIKLPSSAAFAIGDTLTGGSSGASGTVVTISESFSGADKSISNFKDMLNAIMSQLKAIKGTRFWYEGTIHSIEGLSQAINSQLVQNSSATNARFSWSSGNLSITDDNGTPAGSDVIARLRIWGNAYNRNLTRQDATSAPISIADGEILFIDLPEGTDRTYSGAGASGTNYQTVALADWETNDSRYWLAYREGSKLYVRGYGELESGEQAQIGDPINANVLSYIGTDETTALPTYGTIVSHTPRYVGNNDALSTGVAKLSDQLNKINGQLQMTLNQSTATKVNISSNLNTILDSTVLNQYLDGRVLDFSGAVIDFTTGTINEEDDSTALGTNFTPATPSAGEYLWYAITLVTDSINADNTVKGKVLVTAASGSGATPAAAPKATFPSTGLHLGQIVVQDDGSASSGTIEDLTQASIYQLNISAANIPDLTISPFSEVITQAGHGFTSSDLGKQLYFNGTIWALSDCTDPEKLRSYTLIEVIDTDNIRIQKISKATIASHGFTVGEYYFDDPDNPGNVTSTYPTHGYVCTAFFVRDADTLDIFSHELPVDFNCAISGNPAGGGAEAINDLTDVDTATSPPSDGEALVWNNSSSNWIPGGTIPTTIPYDIGFAAGDETTDLTVATINLTMPVIRNMTITDLKGFVSTAPVGANITFDVLVNGSTILNSDASITAGSNLGSSASLLTTSLSAGDKITIEITQIGSSTAGKGFKLLIQGTTTI